MALSKTADSVDEPLELAESIINTVREPLIVLDHDLKVVTASRSFYDAFKVSPEETDGQLIYDLGDKQWDIPDLRELLEVILPENNPFNDYEVEADFPDIGRRTMLLNARQLERKSGKQQLILLAIEDITKHKRLENLLSESEERYRKLFETANDGMVLLEKAEGKITHANPAIAEMIGYSHDEFIGKRAIDIGFPGDIGSIQEILQTLETDGILHYKDAPVQTKTGQLIDTDIYMVDKARLVQCNIRDVTLRKQAETYREMGLEILQILNEPGDLQESIQLVLALLKTRTGVDAVGLRLQEGEDFPYFAQDGFSKDFLLTENTLLERGKDGGVCRDKDGNVRLECTCGLVISGKTDPSNPLFTKGGSSWTNDSFPFLDLPSDQDPRLHPRNNCTHQGYASVALIPVRTNDQIVGLVQLNDKRKDRFNLETIEILEGIVAHIGSALMRKQAEAEREKLQFQLNQAQKMESVGRLAGGVAHDFNNKLTIINGYAEMAIDMMDPSDPLRETIQEIHTAGKQSAGIVRQLLAFARQQTISPVQLNLNDTISGMLKMLQRLIGENIDIEWHPGKDLWPIKIDPSQVDQIMANLAVNTQDAISDVGKLTLETKNTIVDEDYCKTNSEAIPGRYVMLAVSDDGCGMEKEVRDQLFEPFFTTKADGKGTGLGLPTVYGIVKQNKGFINVYSEPGEGTTFKLYFLFCETEKSSVQAVKQSTGHTPTGSEAILLVEDEKAILQLSKQMLERLGYSVQSVVNPFEALKLSEEYDGTIHLLITDVVMPEMNGRDLSSRLIQIYPGIKTLYMSGYTSTVIAHHGVLDDGVHFIQKPFSMNDLAAKVREAIEQ